MLPVGWLVFAVLAAVLLTMWVTFTLTRMDRLHARVDATQAALDAQLVRRAAALQRVAESDDSELSVALNTRYEQIALDALAALEGRRQAAENAVGRALRELAEHTCPLPAQAAAELSEAASRVLIARRFYNDAVRDTRTLRSGRMPRLLRLAGRRAMPAFFDIDDTIPVFAQASTSIPSDSVRPDPAKDSA
ncbi:MAG: hypothetical protein M3N95_03620 [Actinomycetota bacterium]|nr:hypothetical protein [Actinomycetota bacterium]